MEKIIYLIISFFWFTRTLKNVLFWIYLWQLKEYHIGRFIDHFRTHKGKRLIFNILNTVKLFLFFLIFLDYYSLKYFLIWISLFLLIIYAGENLSILKSFYKKQIKKPVFTPKAIILTVISFLLVIGGFYFLTTSLNNFYSAVFLILTFDILFPFFISLVVLCIQPLFVLGRKKILQKARKKISEHKNLKIIAITGSYGKTSTKEFLNVILSEKFHVLATKKNQNSEMGIANCILNELKPEHEIFVVEMGSYKKGGIKLLSSLAKPNIGIVTGVNAQHLALFGSIENLLSAEGGKELINQLPKGGVIILNGDNKYCLELYKKTNIPYIRKDLYSLDNRRINADFWAEEIEVKKNYISFIVRDKDKEMGYIKVNVLGRHNVQNLLAAIAAAKEIGMNFEEISLACQKINPQHSGMTISQGVHSIEIIDSSYSSNPDGVIADLDYLSIFDQKKVIIMPCLIELGKESEKIHRQIGQKIGQICNMAIITTKDKFKYLKLGAMESGLAENKIIFCENPKDILTIITLFCSQKDAVLLEGRVPKKLIELLLPQKSNV